MAPSKCEGPPRRSDAATPVDLLGGWIGLHLTHENIAVQDFASEVDRVFFERWPARFHRIRRAYPAEAPGVEPGPGRRLFVLSIRVATGHRLRAFFEASPDFDTDMGEAECIELREHAFGLAAHSAIAAARGER